MNEYLNIGLFALLFIGLFLFSFSLYEGMSSNKVLRDVNLKQINRLYNTFKEKEKKGWFYKLDLLMLQSNLRRKIKFATTEGYIVVSFFCGSITLMLLTPFYGLFLGILSLIAVLFTFYLFLKVLATINYKRTEDSIITFLNLMGNYSKTNDDINDIFGRIAKHVKEPLKTALEEFHSEMIVTGNFPNAFHNLETKIEHEKLKDIIRNIEICSRYNANYDDIIDDSRKVIREYLADKEERTAIIRSGRVEVLILLACSGFIIKMVDSLLTNNKTIFGLLTQDFIGWSIIGFFIFVIGLCVKVMFSMKHE